MLRSRLLRVNPRAASGRRLASEAVGTALLVTAVVGSGIMGARLSGGNEALAGAAVGTVLFAWLMPTGQDGAAVEDAPRRSG